MFTGSYTAIVTPFKNGQVDEASLRKLIDFQIAGGINGIVPVGTTGEAATLDYDEHLRVIEITADHAKGRARVIAGTSSNSTREAVDLSQRAEKLGIDALLLASPYYNKPTQEGLYLHYKAISEAVSTNIVLYNVPSRTANEIGVETAARLAQDFKNIVSIKEAGGSTERVAALRKVLPPEFTILSGDDPQTLPFMAVGAAGVISVASNVIPKEISQMVKHFAEGDLGRAKDLHLYYFQLYKDLFIESNPIPVKAALHLMGFIEEEYRLPLCKISEDNRKRLRKTLESVKLI
jgi:4-hydroxy-tetrahydrodipicolinate synthase